MRLVRITSSLFVVVPLLLLATGPATAARAAPGRGARAAGTERVSITFTLTGARPAQTQAYAAAVSTPGSCCYRAFLDLAGTTRAVPDIAAPTDRYTAPLVGSTVGSRYGAAPIVASPVALVQATTGPDSDLGFVAPLLYANTTAGTTTTADALHVAAGMWTPTLHASPGGDYLIDAEAESLNTSSWDPVTGLGTPGRMFLTNVG